MLLSVLVAAHHTAGLGSHAGHGTQEVRPHGAMAVHAPAPPASELADEADACLAVLPLLLVLTAVIAAIGAARVWLRVGISRSVPPLLAPTSVLPRPRAGPAVLCVMRC